MTLTHLLKRVVMFITGLALYLFVLTKMRKIILLALGVLVYPLIFRRASFLIVAILVICNPPIYPSEDVPQQVLVISFITTLIHWIFIGRLVSIIYFVFGVRYEISSNWASGMMHSHSIWSHPVMQVKDRVAKISVCEMGGNSISPETQKKRYAILMFFGLTGKSKDHYA